MKKIVVASNNPVKKMAVLHGFQQMFPEETFYVAGVGVPSGVRDQPSSDSETLLGAHNRTERAQIAEPAADFWVGVEGGIEDTPAGMATFAWVVIRSRETIGASRSGTFFLPEAISALVRAGKELGDADDIVFGRSNSKQENGAIGLLTGDVIDRKALYEHAVVLALLPFKNSELYQTGSHGE